MNELREGFTYQPRQMAVDPDEEARQLRLCGIDPALYEGCVDPVAFIGLSIQEGVRNGVSANGAVNMGTTIVQHRPVKLGEPLNVTGTITNVKPQPRGIVATSDTWYETISGERAITASRLSLRPNLDTPDARGAGVRPAPVIEDLSRLTVIDEDSLNPEAVKAYGAKTTNLIHVDPEAAAKSGYRAPIIGGGHGVRYLTAAIWRRFRPRAVSLEIYFRRPLFWDDRFQICAQEENGTWTAVCLLKDGKVATEVRLSALKAAEMA